MCKSDYYITLRNRVAAGNCNVPKRTPRTAQTSPLTRTTPRSRTRLERCTRLGPDRHLFSGFTLVRGSAQIETRLKLDGEGKKVTDAGTLRTHANRRRQIANAAHLETDQLPLLEQK